MDINDILTKAPFLMAEEAEKANKARYAWAMTKTALNRLEAKTYLEVKLKDSKLTQGDLKARVDDDDMVYKARQEVVLKESDYRQHETRIKDLEEKINCAKVLARIKMSEVQNIGG